MKIIKNKQTNGQKQKYNKKQVLPILRIMAF